MVDRSLSLCRVREFARVRDSRSDFDKEAIRRLILKPQSLLIVRREHKKGASFT